MSDGFFATILIATVLWASPLLCGGSRDDSNYDVIVFGATPAGLSASLAAKAAGAQKVLLVEPTAHVGGMAASGGIGLRDCKHNEVRTNNATQYQWAMRNAKFYGVDNPVWQPDNWVGEKTFLDMLKDSGVELRLNTTFVEGSAGINTSIDSDGMRRITGIKLESGKWLGCKYVVDASYEGELMIASGNVTYTFGRESQQQYNESLAGVTNSSDDQFQYPVNPYKSDNVTLLKWIQDGPDPRERFGAADKNVMSYTFRPCLSKDKNNMVPYAPPPGYDPADFELQRRYLLAELAAGKDPTRPWNNFTYDTSYPSSKSVKYDAWNGIAPVGIDAVGLAGSMGYVNATRAQRKAIYDTHRYYVQGLMWFWASDPAVPKTIQDDINSYGLCKDEWPDNGHFPPQLYIREAARIIGDKVFTQNDRVPYSEMEKCYRDSIAVGAWGFEIHAMERVAVRNGSSRPTPYNEGHTQSSLGGDFFFDIPYYVLLPQRKEMVNLAVPNCPSVSHVAFSAIRVEPILWQLGQAAGTAAGVAIQHGGSVALQDIDHQDLQSALIKQNVFVRWPPNEDCDSENVSTANKDNRPEPPDTEFPDALESNVSVSVQYYHHE